MILIIKIQKCAEDLKTSTNNICKSLAENADIPVNLRKAKDDKNIIMGKLIELKADLICGSNRKFNETIKYINNHSINIEKKRKREMLLFEQLKKINDDIAKEENEYVKDSKNLNNRLINEKKKLAKTKLEENIFSENRKNEIDALKDLNLNNYKEDEARLNKEMEEKIKEKVIIFIMFNVLGKWNST